MDANLATQAATAAAVAHTHSPGWFEWLGLAAILLGPLVGIWVTRLIDEAGETRKRRWDLFVTLRRTKGLELTPDHVAAINMVPVLFAKDAAVMTAWGELLDSLNDPAWNSKEEVVREGVMKLSNDKRMNLSSAIARAVGAKLPTKEEHKQGYVPLAWHNEQIHTMEARDQLLKVLKGQQGLQMIAGIYQLPPLSDPIPDSDSLQHAPPEGA